MLLPEIKDAIGQRCASLVEEGDTVFLDESTTCLAVARHLLHRDITVVTNSLDIAQVFSDSGQGKLLLSGGELDRKNRCFVGGSAEDFLSRYYMDKSFVSCRGADRAAGITDGSAVNGRIRSMMLQRAKQRFLVLDHTKLNKANFFRIVILMRSTLLSRMLFQIPAGGNFFVREGFRSWNPGRKEVKHHVIYRCTAH